MNVAADSESGLLTVQEGAVVRVTLSRPERGNTLTDLGRRQLIELLTAARSDPGVRAIVISAVGDKYFCTGMELQASNFSDDRPRPGFVRAALATGAHQLINAIIDCEKPVVTVVNGTAAAMGLYLVLASDITVASTRARFAETFRDRGMVLHCGGAYLLQASVGVRRAKSMALLGRRLSAEEALQWGLLDTVVPPDQLQAAADEAVEKLATGPTYTLGLTKRLINRAVDIDLQSFLEEEAMSVELVGGSHDVKEGVRSFLEKRPARFEGH
jgi:2-(1,2-epoxy-1,2-dihydrophenyl)acetyl-CoA isomerase